MGKILGVVVGVGAVVTLVAGAASLKWYVWDVVVGQSGQADRSMLFWGLPIAFLGGVLLVASFGLALVAKRLIVTHP